MPDHGLFRTGLILSGQRSPADVRRQLDRWVKTNRIVQIRRGVYMLAAPRARTPPHPFAIANAAKKASFVSLESALAHYGMIPEHVPTATSVTTGRPETIETPVGIFRFRHLQQNLFFGFRAIEVAVGQSVLIASPAKALVDLLYLTPDSDDPDYLDELRLTPPESVDVAAIVTTAERSGSRKVRRAIRRILKNWERQ